MNGLPRVFATSSFRRGCASCVVATLLVLGGLFPSSAVAAVVVPGTGWGGGSGVDVCYPSTAACPGVTNVGGIAGAVWQCVELAQRYWESRGWWSGVFPGVNVAYEIFTTFAPNNGLVRVPQGSITNVELGDLLVFNEGVPGGAGHVSVVDYVENGVVFVVEENASSSGRASYSLANGSIGDNSNYVAANAGGANRVYGIVRHPGPRGGGSTPLVDTDSDGVADTTDVCRLQPGRVVDHGCPDDDGASQSVDVNGDGFGDLVGFYDHGNADMEVTIWRGSAGGYQARQSVWRTGVGSWSALAFKTASGDFNGDGFGDVVAFYPYANNQTRAWVFFGTSTGLNPPTIQWDSGTNGWDPDRARYAGVDVNGDGLGDVVAFYDYGNADQASFVFLGTRNGLGAPNASWRSGVNGWSANNARLTAGDFNGDGRGDITAFYDYGSGLTRVFTFYGNAAGGLNAPVVRWDPPANSWPMANSRIIATDYNGDGFSDVIGFFDYGSADMGVFIWPGSAAGLASPQAGWRTGPAQWDVNSIRISAGDVNRDGFGDVTAVYNYGTSQSAWLFTGRASGLAAPIPSWSSDASLADWNRTRFVGTGSLPRKVPSEPVSVTATASNAAATVSWTTPLKDGRSPITGYTVTASPGGRSQSTTGSSVLTTSFTGLANGTAYTFSVVARNLVGIGPARVSAPVTPMGPIVDTRGIVLLAAPVRLLDTRVGGETVDRQFVGSGSRPNTSTFRLPVTARGGIPGTVASVVANVTVTGARQPGYITVFPCGQPRPNASVVNFSSGDTVTNLVLSGVASDGTICLYNEGVAEILVDVSAYFPTTTAFVPLPSPVRLLDTRAGGSTIDGRTAGSGMVTSGGTVTLPVASRGGVPSAPLLAAVVITVADPISDGYITIYPCDQSPPNASNLNFVRGQTIANTVLTRLSASGTVCIYSTGTTHVLVDSNGSFAANATALPAPTRFADSRIGGRTVDGQSQGFGAVASRSVTQLSVAGRGGIAPSATSAVITITATGASGDGFFTVYPCDQPQPGTSNLNFKAGQTIASTVISRLSTSGTVCIYSSAPTHFVADVSASLAG